MRPSTAAPWLGLVLLVGSAASAAGGSTLATTPPTQPVDATTSTTATTTAPTPVVVNCGLEPLNDAETIIVNTWPCDTAVAALRLARCESASTPVNPNAVSPGTKHGRSYGVFQLNERWQSARFQRVTGAPFQGNWQNASANIAVAYDLYKEQGWAPWTCAYSNHLGYLPGRHRV